MAEALKSLFEKIQLDMTKSIQEAEEENRKAELALMSNHQKEMEKLNEKQKRELNELKEANKKRLKDAEESILKMKSPMKAPECPVCLEFMNPPTRIFQCGQGHCLCEICKNNPGVTACPSCRQPIVGRNIGLEHMLLEYQEETGGAGDDTKYIKLKIGSTEISAHHDILQIVDICEDYQKEQKLAKLLEEIGVGESNKIIIFTETKRKCDELTRIMRRDGWPALCTHGGIDQKERDWVLNDFKNGSTPILVATDWAARGLDVDDIKVVINYDYPNNSEDYVHRIGRTGRQGRSGFSYTFFTPKNTQKARDLIKVLSEAEQVVNPKLQELAGLACARIHWMNI